MKVARGHCLPGLIALVALATASGAKAGLVTTSALKPGTVNLLDDRDGDKHLNKDGDATITVNDFLLAILKVDTIDYESGAPSQSINDVGSGYNELTAVALIKVATATPIPSTPLFSFTFKAPTAAEWLAETGMVVSGPGVMVASFDDPSHNYNRTSGTLATSLATANNGTSVWEFGFTGVTDLAGNVFAGAGEGWSALAPASITSAPAFGGSITFALNVLATGPAAAGVTLLPTTQFSGFAPFGPTLAQLQGSGTFEPKASGSPWDVFSNTNGYVTIAGSVPEPASFLIWGTLAASVTGCAALRRRRRV